MIDFKKRCQLTGDIISFIFKIGHIAKNKNGTRGKICHFVEQELNFKVF